MITTEKNKYTEQIYVVFTMDCERIKKFSPPGGPESWEASERAIIGFSEILKQKGFKGTFFVVPEAAEKHKALFNKLANQRFEVGMHFHPQSFRNLDYNDYLGGYSYREQVKILKEGIQIWSEALRMHPRSFRSGNFSANNNTFPVLVELGFKQGSLSLPGRNLPEFKAIWQNAYPFAHHANSKDKLISGSLPFYEVPVTVNEQKYPMSNRWGFDLRIERAEFREHQSTIDENVSRMKKEGILVKTLVAITHNMFDYSDKRNTVTKTLQLILDYLLKLREKTYLQIISSTLEEIHSIADEKSEKQPDSSSDV